MSLKTKITCLHQKPKGEGWVKNLISSTSKVSSSNKRLCFESHIHKNNKYRKKLLVSILSKW